MADLLSLIHPRALLRHAVVRVFRSDPQIASLVAGRVYPNREAPYLGADLPACSVYTVDEARIDARQTPDPSRREMRLALEFVAELNQTDDGGLDDLLDSFCLAAENAMDIDRVGVAMGAIVDGALAAQGEPPLGAAPNGRHPADTLISLVYQSVELGLAEDGERTLGAAALTWTVQYDRPRVPVALNDFLMAHIAYDTAGDEHLAALDIVNLPPATPEETP